jgi:cobalt/nickel transport system permease protein
LRFYGGDVWLLTYLTTAVQLALAFPARYKGGFMASFVKFVELYLPSSSTLPLSEELLTVLVWNWLQNYGQRELKILKLIKS